MTSNKARAQGSALSGLDDILAGVQVAPERLPTAKSTEDRPMQKFGLDVRALIAGLDDETGLLEPVSISGNSSDEESPVKSGLIRTDTYLSAFDPGANTWSRVVSNHAIKVLDSIARAVSTNSDAKTNRNCRGMHLILNVTAGAAVGNEITPTIQGYDPLFNIWYDIVQGSAINANGINVLKVYPGILGAGVNIVSDILPKRWRVSIAHAGAAPVTYSAAANLVV